MFLSKALGGLTTRTSLNTNKSKHRVFGVNLDHMGQNKRHDREEGQEQVHETGLAFWPVDIVMRLCLLNAL